MKIVIDAGHGQNYNQSPADKTYFEGNAMFKLAQMEKEELLKYKDVNVILTRNSINEDPSLTTRGQMAEDADLIISDHTNAVASTVSPVIGVEIYRSVKRPNDVELANKLCQAIADVMSTNNRGVKVRESINYPGSDYYTVINASIASGCKHSYIVEHGFHTSYKDTAFLNNDSNLRRLAIAKVKVIAEYFGLVLKSVQAPTSDGILYRVQVGAYSVKVNADKLKSDLNAKGFDAIVKLIDGFYKVQVGAYSKKENADNMLLALSQKGYRGFITTNK